MAWPNGPLDWPQPGESSLRTAMIDLAPSKKTSSSEMSLLACGLLLDPDDAALHVSTRLTVDFFAAVITLQEDQETFELTQSRSLGPLLTPINAFCRH